MHDFFKFQSEVLSKEGTPYVHSISALASVLAPEEWVDPMTKRLTVEFVRKWREEHGLTDGEVTSIIASKLSSDARFLVRAERHPDDPDKPGGEA